MGIINISIGEVGQEGERPRRNKIVTTDALAVVTAAGYLNNGVLPRAIDATDIFDIIYSYSTVTGTGTYDQFLATISAAGVITLAVDVSAGNVLLPVVSGNFAVFNGTTGQIKDAGYLPSNAAKTVVAMVGSAVVANHMALFQDTTGTIDDTAATAINAGSIQAGLSGTAGTVISFPATAASGSMIMAAVANVGNFTSTLSSVTGLAQSTVYTLPDPANAIARVLVGATATPFTTAHILASSGTGGLVADSGIATSAVQLNTNIKAASTADIGGGGAGPISVVVAGLTAASKIVATIASSSNVVAVAKCIATATGFDITFSGDPGAACVVNYVAFVAAQ